MNEEEEEQFSILGTYVRVEQLLSQNLISLVAAVLKGHCPVFQCGQTDQLCDVTHRGKRKE